MARPELSWENTTIIGFPQIIRFEGYEDTPLVVQRSSQFDVLLGTENQTNHRRIISLFITPDELNQIAWEHLTQQLWRSRDWSGGLGKRPEFQSNGEAYFFEHNGTQHLVAAIPFNSGWPTTEFEYNHLPDYPAAEHLWQQLTSDT